MSRALQTGSMAVVAAFVLFGFLPLVSAQTDPRCESRPDHPQCLTTTTLPSGTTTTVPSTTTTAPPSTTTTAAPTTTQPPPPTTAADGACLIVIDEDSIDETLSTIAAAAAMHGVAAASLVNDDVAGTEGNPWLTWSADFAGDVAVLPTGSVADEGWFSLPEDAPWPLQEFVDGTVPQVDLAAVAGVMPIRNQDLATMVGTTCVGVVYDGDVVMAYEPLTANLQGDRSGLFAFTILDVQLAGTSVDCDATASAEAAEICRRSLYEVVVEVEDPTAWSYRFAVPIHDHEPDVLKLGAIHGDEKGTVLVVAGSAFDPDVDGWHTYTGAKVTVSIEGFTFEEPMPWNDLWDRYQLLLDSGGQDLDGRRISIQSDEGGVDNGLVE